MDVFICVYLLCIFFSVYILYILMTQIHHLYFSQSQYFTQHDSQKQASASEAKWTSVEIFCTLKLLPPPESGASIN